MPLQDIVGCGIRSRLLSPLAGTLPPLTVLVPLPPWAVVTMACCLPLLMCSLMLVGAACPFSAKPASWIESAPGRALLLSLLRSSDALHMDMLIKRQKQLLCHAELHAEPEPDNEA